MRISLLLAASLAGCLLYIAVQKGYVQHLYGAGIMYIVLAAVTFIITMFIGIFTGKVHWQ